MTWRTVRGAQLVASLVHLSFSLRALSLNERSITQPAAASSTLLATAAAACAYNVGARGLMTYSV